MAHVQVLRPLACLCFALHVVLALNSQANQSKAYISTAKYEHLSLQSVLLSVFECEQAWIYISWYLKKQQLLGSVVWLNETSGDRSAMFMVQIAGVSILRAGETMEQALREVSKDVSIGKILIQTNLDTGEPEVR